jgi:hypothetical protein
VLVVGGSTWNVQDLTIGDQGKGTVTVDAGILHGSTSVGGAETADGVLLAKSSGRVEGYLVVGRNGPGSAQFVNNATLAGNVEIYQYGTFLMLDSKLENGNLYVRGGANATIQNSILDTDVTIEGQAVEEEGGAGGDSDPQFAKLVVSSSQWTATDINVGGENDGSHGTLTVIGAR